MSETKKIRHVMEKYLKGKVIDIGCGDEKICESAIGVDGRKLANVDVVLDICDLRNELLRHGHDYLFDVVFSSHVLEHLPDDQAALKNWISILKTGGHLCLYLPDDRFYDNKSNPEHLSYYTYPDFIMMIQTSLNGVEIVESGPHVGPDKYSFYVVLKKVSNQLES